METFWNKQRLTELNRMWKTHSAAQLESYFELPIKDISQAYRFQKLHKRLKISSTKTKGVRVTVYAPLPYVPLEGLSYRQESWFF